MIKKLKEKMILKKNGGKEVFVELGLGIIGVVLLAIFKTQASNLVTSISTQISNAVSSLF